MKYYIVPAELAEKLKIKSYRSGKDKIGYLCNTGDFATFGIASAVAAGAKLVTEQEAIEFYNTL